MANFPPLSSWLLCMVLPLLLVVQSRASYELANSFPNGSWIDRGSFPPDFVFGAMTWAVKHEGAAKDGGKGESIWDKYALEKGTVDDGTTPNDAGHFYYRYKDDIKFVPAMSMTALRFSISWPRIFPNGSGEINQDAIAYYNDLIDRLLEQGTEPYVTLYEQDLPQALQASYGGLLSSRIIEDFANYANVCFNAFGDRVKNWVTFEEPNDFIPYAYASSYSPPGRCSIGIPGYGNCSAGNSSTEPYIVAHNVLRAHAAASAIYRNEYQETQKGSLGLAIWFRWFEPLSDTPVDLAAAQRATAFTVGWFLDPLFYGDYPAIMRTLVGDRLPSFSEEESATLKGSIDFVGLNAVTAIYVTEDDNYQTNNTGYYQDWKAKLTAYRNGTVIGVYVGEYSVPWCLEKIAHYMKVTYNNPPAYLTALGWGLETLPLEQTLDDSDRIRFFASYLSSLLVGIRDGADIRGAFAWSLIDGFEFTIGKTIRFGLYYVDSDFNRYPRLSSLWFKEILSANQTAPSGHTSI